MDFRLIGLTASGQAMMIYGTMPQLCNALDVRIGL